MEAPPALNRGVRSLNPILPHHSRPPVSHPHSVLARMYEHIDPLDRGQRYEEPLQAALEAAQAGIVTGGGSQLGEVGEIVFVDLDIDLADMDAALDLVIRTLEQAGAPQGSEILRGTEVLREFGAQQCLAVYLDGISLPDEVYATLDFDGVVAQLGAAAGPDSYRGFWQGPEETGLYFFGPDAEEMFGRVEPLLRDMPIGQNARVVVRHGRDSLQPRTLRMPRQQPGGPA